MRIAVFVIVLAISIALVGCEKEESKPAPEQQTTSAPKPAESSQAVQQAEQMAQETKEKVEQMAEQAKEKVDQAVEQTQEKAAQIEQKAQDMVQTATAALSSGQSVYDKNCAACHKLGIAGAPKTGDKAAWAPHIESGIDHLTQNAINGVGKMPPKGGNSMLTDDEVRAAVEYIVEQSR